MVDIKEGISWVQSSLTIGTHDTFKPIIAMYFADGAEKPLDNFIETVSYEQVRENRPKLVQKVKLTVTDSTTIVCKLLQRIRYRSIEQS